MIDWIIDNFGWILGTILVLIFALGIGSCRADMLAKRDFMEECRIYEPNYKCEHLWRSSRKNDPTYVPIFIPSGR